MIDMAALLLAWLHNAMNQRSMDNNRCGDEICQAIDDYNRYDHLLI